MVKWVMGGFAICVEIFNGEIYDSTACEIIYMVTKRGRQKRCGLEQTARGLLKEE
jgi:hypothetical protein